MRGVSRAARGSSAVQVNAVELLTFGGAIVADRILGEWPNALHPVVWMGKGASWLERGLPARTPAVEFAWGAMIAVVVPTSFAAASAFVLAQTKPWPVLECAIGILLLKSTFALRELARAAENVERALTEGSLDKARYGLRS